MIKKLELKHFTLLGIIGFGILALDDIVYGLIGNYINIADFFNPIRIILFILSNLIIPIFMLRYCFEIKKWNKIKICMFIGGISQCIVSAINLLELIIPIINNIDIYVFLFEIHKIILLFGILSYLWFLGIVFLRVSLKIKIPIIIAILLNTIKSISLLTVYAYSLLLILIYISASILLTYSLICMYQVQSKSIKGGN